MKLVMKPVMMKVITMKKIKILSVVLMALGLLTGRSMALDAIGTISEINGQATAKQPGGAAVRPLKKGSEVFLNDQVETARDARLQMTFVDGSTIRQGESSELLINEYVFNPADKQDNSASFKITRGIFRVITDKITRLNPERFKVSTNYGTIGIRGCDLMFDIRPDGESVFVVGLHHADSVVVDLDLPAGPNQPAMKDQTVIRAGGRVVEMSAVNGMKIGQAVMRQLRVIDQATKPKIEVNAPPAPAEAPAAPPVEDADEENSSKAAKLRKVGDETLKLAIVNAMTVLPESAPVVPPAPAPVVEQTVAEAPAPVVATKVREEPEAVEPVEVVQKREPAPEPEPELPEEPSKTYPIVGARTSTTIASGTDWSWGAWEQEIIDLDVNGDEETFVDRETFVSGNTITGQAFRDIRDGAAIYNLSGSGQAGAAILGDKQSDLVSGTADVNVLVGGSVTPTWSSDVNMSGGTSALAFKSSGSIDDNGGLNGSVSNYSLNAFGNNKGTPSSESVSGNLVGPGTGSAPVSGAIGKFDFEHSDGTKVKGVFGSDLR